MKRLFLTTLFLIASYFCKAQENALSRIAFGSCSKDEEQQLWQEIINQKPHLWIWLGDNIYGDTQDTAVLRKKYKRQKENVDYQRMLKAMPVIGTWDDHDYGVNDGGKYNSKKKECKEVLLEFLDVPASADVRKHEGVYSSYTYGSLGKKIKIILLDTRYFRDTLEASTIQGTRYSINNKGDVLGEPQWAWLEKELTDSDADVHIVGSSIQFIPEEQGFEKWANFPKARQRFLDLLQKTKPNNIFIISGDRHIAEISKMDVTGLLYPLYEFTSSGLTHTWDRDFDEANHYRVGSNVIQKNFGMILIDWTKQTPSITFEVWGKDGRAYLRYTAF